MEKVKLYNTLTRNKDEFAKNVDQEVGLYTCGPTVYNFAHLGNLRTYIFEDILKRTLLYNGYQVKHVMNITDVGHLTGDMDMGEDKLELEAAKEHKSAWEIAEFYAKAFKEDLASLNVIEPSIWCKATDNINEQIELIKILESKGFVYQTSDGLYFDTSKFPAYNKLSHLNLEELKEGARVERNDEKRNPTDFALWKLSPSNSGRQMEWDSPWGVGFPGWHLECSAMSLKYLKGELDIHCGGVDHINIHHTNEIAQSEAATGEKFFDYWLHGAFLNIAGGKKMAKSEDNFLTLKTALSDKGIDPLAFRYACLMTHYRKPMEWSGEGITNASNGLRHLYAQIRLISNSQFPISKQFPNPNFQIKFRKVINDDLNMPQAMAIVQEVLKSDLSNEEKLATALDFDKVLGLDLAKATLNEDLPEDVKKIVSLRDVAREQKNWSESDRLRDELNKLGYSVEDNSDGSAVRKI